MAGRGYQAGTHELAGLRASCIGLISKNVTWSGPVIGPDMLFRAEPGWTRARPFSMLLWGGRCIQGRASQGLFSRTVKSRDACGNQELGRVISGHNPDVRITDFGNKHVPGQDRVRDDKEQASNHRIPIPGHDGCPEHGRDDCDIGDDGNGLRMK